MCPPFFAQDRKFGMDFGEHSGVFQADKGMARAEEWYVQRQLHEIE